MAIGQLSRETVFLLIVPSLIHHVVGPFHFTITMSQCYKK